MRSRSIRRPARPQSSDTAEPTVFAVHTTHPDSRAGAVEVVFTDERSARAYAQSRSTDHRITSASVTRYTVGQLGSRHPVAWYQRGAEQDVRAARPDQRFYPTDHPSPVPEVRPHQPAERRPPRSAP
jgi:hypothetical protein